MIACLDAPARKVKTIPESGVRLGVKGGGCSGMSYVIEFCDQPRARDQVIFAVIAAVGCFAVRELAHAVYFFLAGLLIANIWEAARRVRVERHRLQMRAEPSRI